MLYKINHFVWLFLLFGFFAQAQDTLYLFDGNKRNVVVKEITPTQVKFLDSRKPDGPIYSLDHISISHIIYSNGLRDTLKILYPRASVEEKTATPIVVKDETSNPTVKQYGDSLFFHNGTKRNVRVKNITPNELEYEYLSKGDGNGFKIKRTSISHIKYSDGYVDSLKSPKAQVHRIAKSKAETPLAENYYQNEELKANSINGDKLILTARRDFKYQNKPLREKSMLLKTEAFNFNAKDKELQTLIDLTKREKKIQLITGFGGPALLLAGVIIAAADGSGGGALLLLGVCVPAFSVTQIISRIHKSKRRKHARMTAERYNQLILQQ